MLLRFEAGHWFSRLVLVAFGKLRNLLSARNVLRCDPEWFEAKRSNLRPSPGYFNKYFCCPGAIVLSVCSHCFVCRCPPRLHIPQRGLLSGSLGMPHSNAEGSDWLRGPLRMSRVVAAQSPVQHALRSCFVMYTCMWQLYPAYWTWDLYVHMPHGFNVRDALALGLVLVLLLLLRTITAATATTTSIYCYYHYPLHTTYYLMLTT